ncbi:MAG: TonB-dependent receptor plug domain-containing protein [Pseudomonadota bacterium]
MTPAIGVAQTEQQSFTPDYFERFAPQTALDMLRQVPGFSVRSTGGGRGLGQGGTNVLIDGERITSKDTNVIDVLSQTPAQTVVRIEVGDAASMGVTGLNGQVANVVLDRSAFSGSFEWRPLFRSDVRPRLTEGLVSVSGEVGELSYTLGLSNDSWRGFELGPEWRLAPDGELLDLREERVSSRVEAPRVTASVDYAFSDKTSLNLTGSATSFGFELREFSDGFDDSRIALSSEDEWNADLSGELSHDLGPGTLRLIGYQRFEHSPTLNRTDTTTFGVGFDSRSFDQVADEGESIGRIEYGWANAGGGSWEVAAESAYNFLDVESFVLVEDAMGSTTTVFPPTKVNELRNQASVTRGMTFGEKLAVQASVAGEWSRITVEGEEADREQTFLRPKGLISLSYPWSETFDMRGRVERAVGQLSFFQFISSVDLTEDRGFSGNTGLVPQQSWIGEVEFEKRFGADEKIIVRLVGELIEDRVDRVLIDGQDAVGNIDEARSLLFETEGTVLLDRWSVPGGRFDFSYEHFSSQIQDQIDLENRGFNGAFDWAYNLDFRQDIPSTPYAWGLGANARDDSRFYRFNEITTQSDSTPDYSAFFEHKDLYGLNLRVAVRNLANRDYNFNRVRYAGLRTEEPVSLIEDRVRIDNRRFIVTLAGTF